MGAVLDVLGTVVHIQGSVIPRVMTFALPAAALATTLRVLKQRDLLHSFFGELEILADSAAYTGFTSALALLLVFRTSQSYSRYWEGITLGHRMFAEWHDFTSSLIAFTRMSKAEDAKVQAFRHRLVRLVSILHATASASLRTMESTHFELIDPDGLENLTDIATATDFPASLMGQWLLELVMEGIDEGVVSAPPPIVSRAFQEFSNGMVAFHDGMKLGTTPFPFPYSQITAVMLLTHACVTPFVMCNWVLWPTWVFIVTLMVTMVFWSLYFTALDIENPFQPGDTRSQYEATRVQKEFNTCLLLLLSKEARAIPPLSPSAALTMDELSERREIRSVHVPNGVYNAEMDDLKPSRSSRSNGSTSGGGRSSVNSGSGSTRPSLFQRIASPKQDAPTSPPLLSPSPKQPVSILKTSRSKEDVPVQESTVDSEAQSGKHPTEQQEQHEQQQHASFESQPSQAGSRLELGASLRDRSGTAATMTRHDSSQRHRRPSDVRSGSQTPAEQSDCNTQYSFGPVLFSSAHTSRHGSISSSTLPRGDGILAL